jgi:hypothetical protein
MEGKMEEEIIKPGYTRVSEILRIFNDFSTIDPYILENAKNRGSRVHAAIDEYIKTAMVLTELEEQDKPYFESFMSWYESIPGIEKEITHNEVRLYDDKRMITGKIDGVLRRGGRLILIDWKTSSSANDLSWPLQAALYVQLIRKNKLCDISDTVIFLQLDKYGGPAREHVYEICKPIHKMANWAVNKFRKEAKKEAREEEIFDS